MDFQCCLSELAHIQSSDSSTPLPSSFSNVKTKYRTPVNVSENQSARMTQPGAMLSSTCTRTVQRPNNQNQHQP